MIISENVLLRRLCLGWASGHFTRFMKTRHRTLGAIALGAVAISWLVIHAAAQTPAETYNRSMQEYQKQQAAYQKQLVDYQKQQAEYAETMKGYAEALAKHEELMKRYEKDLERFEAILATHEKQQAQYQQYLDSLPKKK